MTLNPEITFTQDGALKRTHREFVEKGLVEETKEAFGICFRASFKWLACKIEGLTFPYYADKLVSAYKKQLAYLEQPSDLLEMDISYASWVEAVRDQDVLFLNKWGSRDPYRLQCQAMRVPQLRGSMPLAGDFVVASTALKSHRATDTGATPWLTLAAVRRAFSTPTTASTRSPPWPPPPRTSISSSTATLAPQRTK